MASSLKDVAKVAGVSAATASLVLNGRDSGRVSPSSAELVRKVARNLNYEPNLIARSLRTQVSKTIGLISEDVATTPFAGAMLAGAQAVVWESGWLLLLVNVTNDLENETQAVRSLIARNVDGFIYASMYHKEIELPRYLDGQQVVLLDCTESNSSRFSSIVPSEYEGAKTAVENLISNGHTKIAHITSAADGIAVRERLRAYREVLSINGIKVPASYVQKAEKADAPDGYLAAKALLKNKILPTAIFCYTDRMAMGAYAAIQEAGLSVPGDISVVGFDDQPFLANALRPGLTTVQLPHYEMGAWAAKRLIGQIDPKNSDSPSPEAITCNCPLVIRDSVAPPRS